MHAIVAAAMAGLMATPHCAGMCGGFATACARPRAGLAAWHGGRLATYGVLGALAGTFGRVLPGPAWVPAVLSAVLLVWFAAVLAGFAPQPSVRMPGLARAGQLLARRPSTPARFLFGMVTGLLPCGMVYAALSIAIAAAHPAYSAAAMVAFGAATVPGLTVLSVGVQRFVLRGPWSRRMAAGVILLFGLWTVGQRGLHGGHAGAHGMHGGAAAPASPAVESSPATHPVPVIQPGPHVH
jgi:uncharacterized protein